MQMLIPQLLNIVVTELIQTVTEAMILIVWDITLDKLAVQLLNVTLDHVHATDAEVLLVPCTMIMTLMVMELVKKFTMDAMDLIMLSMTPIVTITIPPSTHMLKNIAMMVLTLTALPTELELPTLTMMTVLV
jgi:hypothetical protein